MSDARDEKSVQAGGGDATPAFVAVLSGLPRAVFNIPVGEVVLGRAPDAAVRLDHLEISRRHCRITWDGRNASIEDLGSRWGTRLADRALTAAAILPPGSVFALGAVTLFFGVGESPSNQALEQLAAESETGGADAAITMRGETVTQIPLAERVTFGRDAHSDVVLTAPMVSRQHAIIQRHASGFRVSDLQSSSGSFINGHRFDEHDLTIGDRLRIGPFHFQFDGRELHVLGAVSGGAIQARGVSAQVNERTILDDVSLEIAPSRFAGIIGPSGAGKSSLLNALSGMRAPQRGLILVNGIDLAKDKRRRAIGFVPQEDIVHGALTVMQALRFAAQLRLPRGTPASELQKLIAQTLDQLGLSDRATTRIANLSGGQRKRVSVAAELLARPPVLFLDEPTSGLDPATEFKLMELLRGLADTGCTVICSTHVMENVYLMDQLLVLFGGCLVFDGTPQKARDFFAVPRLPGLYEKLEERSPAQWREEFQSRDESRAPQEETPPAAPPPETSDPRPSAFGILLRRQLAILRADWRNAAILLGQPLVLAALVSWVSDDHALLCFFAYIATLWFGCSNGAQEIVGELAIYRRERIVGVGRGAYLASKFLFLGALTAVQAALFYVCLQIGERGLDGAAAWQCGALLASAFAAAGLGLVISSLASTLMQAVVAVPLILIPLILFSGYTVPANEMKPTVLLVGRCTPSFAAQRVMDISFLWRKQIAHQTLGDHWTSFRNVNRDEALRTGEIFDRPRPGAMAFGTLGLWIAGTFAASLLALRSREKNQG